MGTPRRVATARARHAHGTRHAVGGESNGSHGRAEAGERQGRSRHRRSARASATCTFSVPRRHTTRTRRTTTPQRGSRPDACLHSHARVPCGLHGLRIRPPLRSARPAGHSAVAASAPAVSRHRGPVFGSAISLRGNWLKDSGWASRTHVWATWWLRHQLPQSTRLKQNSQEVHGTMCATATEFHAVIEKK